MELPGSGCFYALAALAMAFTGFTSIVVVLRQGTGKPLSPLHALFTRVYIELGLMASAFAMLAPVLALFELREIMIWQISSVIVIAALVPWLFFFPIRRKTAAPKDRLPLRFYNMYVVGTAVVLALALNTLGLVFTPGPGPLAVATVYVLAVGSVIFIGNYSSYLLE
jgi:hydrogenase-4 membrane subunit HyfE